MKRAFFLLSTIVTVAALAFAANIAGTWTINGNVSNAPQTLVLSVTGSTLSGTADGVAISGAGISKNGSELWFQVVKNGARTTYKGAISGTQLTLFASSGSTGALVYNHQ